MRAVFIINQFYDLLMAMISVEFTLGALVLPRGSCALMFYLQLEEDFANSLYRRRAEEKYYLS